MLATLEDDMATGFAKLFGDSPESEFVPPVESADMRAVWTMQKNYLALFSEGIMIHADEYKKACRPGADVRAVVERTSMLGLLQTAAVLKLEDEVDDAVFQALATIPMKRLEVGVVHEGPPFDIQELLRQVNQNRGQQA
jgi:hypothetical protein